MDPAEVQFLAEKEPVTIVPNFSENKLFLLSVSFYWYNEWTSGHVIMLLLHMTGRIRSIQSLYANQSASVAGC